jgi:endo-1,3-1,4-beta-glycanase ExoK
MQAVRHLICLFVILVVLIPSTCIGATEYPSNEVLKWKGQNWHLTDGKANPGNNYWNNKGAWIDKQNRLHLTIVNNESTWKCTEVKSQNKYLYGTFTWTVASPVYTIDKNSVIGLFTYHNDSQELDVEVSRWGKTSWSNFWYFAQSSKIEGNNLGYMIPSSMEVFIWSKTSERNLWYSVQPSKIEGNSLGYMIPFTIMGTNTTYRIEWKPTYVRFTSMQESGEVIADFNYTNISGIPQQPERVIMNLWLLAPPSDGKNIELIISNFTVTKN